MIPVILILSIWLSTFPPISHDPGSCGLADAKVKAAMRYHGINFATWENGKGTFERDGQVCRLYTKAFEKKWGKR